MTKERKTVQRQNHTDSPESYCCELLEDAVEELGCIQYRALLKEYTIVNDEGYAALPLTYCPFCGADVTSQRDLWHEKYIDYVLLRQCLTFEELERHWPIISQCLSFEETMGLNAEEAAREEAGVGTASVAPGGPRGVALP
jgi:hypothetical protein